jgi:hypothetical protein
MLLAFLCICWSPPPAVISHATPRTRSAADLPTFPPPPLPALRRPGSQEWKAERKVEDYSINQVTLEQVFLNVTHKERGSESVPKQR